MGKVLKFLLFLHALCMVAGARNFQLGRGRGGNLGVPHVPSDYSLPKARWFKQRLDHFYPSDVTTWKQRYYVNDTFFDFKNPGPVFLMIGGEGPADARWMVQGAWIEYAKKYKALCLNLEHRFYGESRPTADVSVKNLVYLSSHQALADLANFISAMNDQYRFDNNIKWIAFGGSYPGSLAAWLRLKYPHLVYGAISTSGPLLAEVNFQEYFEVVVGALREKTGSEDCVNQVREAHNQITKLVRDKPLEVEAKFRLCKSLSNATEKDVQNLYNSLANNFADLVQYNEDNRIGRAEEYRNITINTVCNILTQPGASPAYERMALFNSLMLNKSNETCLDFSYDNMINELRSITWSQAEGGRQWFYQTCSEFGFYQTSSAEVDIFGNNFTIDFFTQQCQDIFGKKFSPTFLAKAVEWTNTAYGALDIAASRVVFVHGSVDPWHALGITKTQNNDAPAIYIKGTAHCANMYPSTDTDPSELKEARVEIQQYIGTWLNQI